MLQLSKSGMTLNPTEETWIQQDGKKCTFQDIMELMKTRLWTIFSQNSLRKDKLHQDTRLVRSSLWRMMPKLLQELSLRQLINLRPNKFLLTLTLISKTLGDILIRTMRVGSDTKKLTLSKDTSKVNWTNSPTRQDLLLISHQVVLSTHWYILLTPKLSQLAKYEKDKAV